jgi:protein TonB
VQVAEVAKPAPSDEELVAEFVEVNFDGIRSLVLEHLRYPKKARRMHIEGTGEIEMLIDPSGKLSSAKVHKSSGYKILDEAALKAATALSSLALPKPKTLAKVMLPIEFILN